MEVKITTLIENNADDKGQLLYEHGLSLLVETQGKNILFDTGRSGNFIENAKLLNKSLDELDYCIISHGHYDHSGGVEMLIHQVKKHPTFLVGEEFFSEKYKKEGALGYKFNGNSFDEELIVKNQIPLRKVKEDMLYLTDHIIVFHHFSKYTEYEKRNSDFYIKEDSKYSPDYFYDEIALCIITEKGLVVIVGCSHVGIINILKTITNKVNIPIFAVIGGTHLVDADEIRIEKTIIAFEEMKIQHLALSHCTGENGMNRISKELELQFLFNNTGRVVEI